MKPNGNQLEFLSPAVTGANRAIVFVRAGRDASGTFLWRNHGPRVSLGRERADAELTCGR